MKDTEEPILGIVAACEAPSADSGAFTPGALMAEASSIVMEQAGVTKDEVDGLWSASAYQYMPTLSLAEHLGIRPRYSDSTTIGGSSFVAHLRHAAAAIKTGMCNVGILAYGSTQRTDGQRTVRSLSEPLAYEIPYGLAWPISGYGLMATRHMHQYGTKPEHLAEIAVAAREWAVLNPDCAQTKQLTIDDVLDSPMICSPLHRYDCCLVTNGGGAALVTSPERARDLTDKPIYVWGVAESHRNRFVSAMPDYTSSPAQETARPAMQQAGITHDDVDTYHLYDAFTIAVLVMLEDLGLCAKGEAGAFLEDGRLRPGGPVPVNTSGGGLSYRHPGMLGIFLLIEAVTQLRNEGGPRQVSGADCSLVHGLGGVHMSGVTAVLGGPRWRI
jgi:acetyl-CoA acetyltransferase